MAYSLIAWQNYAKASSITATTAQASLPPTNICGDSGSPSAGWQSTTCASTQTLTIKPNAAGQSWDVAGIFRTNLTSNAVIVWSLMSNSGSTVYTATTTGTPIAGYGQVVVVFPVGTVADYLTIAITDTSNPDGFLNVPLAFAGPSFQPIGSISFESTTGRDYTIAETTARGGSEFPVLFYQRRRYEAVFDSLRRDELWTSVDVLATYAAGGSNVLIVPNMTAGHLQQQAVFGRLKPSADISYPYGASDRRKWSATITERL
jgi:hypothetical protein